MFARSLSLVPIIKNMGGELNVKSALGSVQSFNGQAWLQAVAAWDYAEILTIAFGEIWRR